jgi:hypothetical protein
MCLEWPGLLKTSLWCLAPVAAGRLVPVDDQVVESVNGPTRENCLFLPGHKLPENLVASGSLSDVVSSCELLLMVVPTPFVEATLKPVTDELQQSNSILVSCTKGILNETLETVHEVLVRVLPKPLHSNLAYLSGELRWQDLSGPLNRHLGHPALAPAALHTASSAEPFHSSQGCCLAL